MLARCQFGIDQHGRCTATLTYPIKGMPWRRNVMKAIEFDLDGDTKALLFSEVERLRRQAPRECLDADMTWSDTTEMANAITRERESGKLCVTLAIIKEGGEVAQHYSMREDSPALLASALFKTISGLLQAHEQA